MGPSRSRNRLPEIRQWCQHDHFISDGPTTQYRNKQNFYLFSTRIYDKGFRGGTWNFLEAGHGKGAADGIGAAIKRLADKVVQRRGQDITCSQDLLNGVDATDTKVKMFLVEESDISRLESAIPSKLVVVKDTMKIHQVRLLSVLLTWCDYLIFERIKHLNVYSMYAIKCLKDSLSKILWCHHVSDTCQFGTNFWSMSYKVFPF